MNATPPSYNTTPAPQYSASNEPPVSAAPPQQARVKLPGGRPVVTYILMGITIFVFLLQLGSQTIFSDDLPVAFGAKINELILQGQYWRLFTPIFLHGSILHILFNMYALYVLGPGLERFFGGRRYLALYLISGFAGNVFSFLFSNYSSVGASGAIFGLIGAEGVFLYYNREFFALLGRNIRQTLINVIVVAALNLLIGLSPGIDDWAHLGGLLSGVFFTWLGGPLLKLGGLFPDFTILDQREEGDAWRAGILVGLAFLLITVAAIYLRGGLG